MRNYKVLRTSSFENNNFKLIPIRYEDRFDIMKWRNEQIYHLRQEKILTIEDQENYFINTVASLFEQEKPSQILFSFLKNNKFIGYGGLVHINWIDKNAEISFVMNTKLEKDNFSEYWTAFLNLIEKIAFEELDMHKIFTYAFDLRPQIYPILVENKFQLEAIFKEHVFFKNQFIDVYQHMKLNSLDKL